MESIIAMWVGRFERGAISRREPIQSLTVLATAAAGTTASAAGFDVSAIDHIQINASNAKRSSEWYQRVLGLKAVRAGEMGDESEEIAHVGTPGNLRLSLRKLSRPDRSTTSGSG